MFDSQVIRQMSDEAAAKAKRKGVQPMKLMTVEAAFNRMRQSPFVGDYVPKGWRPMKRSELASSALLVKHLWKPWRDSDSDESPVYFFVDNSGMGRDDELALSGSQTKLVAEELAKLAAATEKTIGTALVEVGQFQAVLGVFVETYQRKAG